MDDELRRYLTDHDASCIKCAYNLRGLVDSICPECGRWVILAELLEPRRRRTAAWWLGLPPLMAMALFAIPGIIGSALGIVGGPKPLLLLFVPLLLVSGWAYWYECRWIGKPDRLLRKPSGVQWLLAGLNWLALAAVLSTLRLLAEYL